MHVNWKAKFGEPRERYWSLKEIEAAYRDEHPEWSDVEAQMSSQTLFDALRELERSWHNSQRRFHSHVTTVGLRVDEADDPDSLID